MKKNKRYYSIIFTSLNQNLKTIYFFTFKSWLLTYVLATDFSMFLNRMEYFYNFPDGTYQDPADLYTLFRFLVPN